MSQTWSTIAADAVGGLEDVADETFHAAVTSPPYWSLRNYQTGGIDWPAIDYQPVAGVTLRVEPWTGELGLEPTVADYVGHLVYVMRSVRRALRSEGTVWLNLGDTYQSGVGGRCPGGDHFGKANPVAVAGNYPNTGPNRVIGAGGLKPKDLAGVPWRVALALQADGWWLRSDVIWHKVNAMPSSVRDRPTTAHEYLFLLSKSRSYFYDLMAELQPYSSPPHAGGGMKGQASIRARGNMGVDSTARYYGRGGRNLRSVWRVKTEPSGVDHFATFPVEIPRRCISLSTSEHGCCSSCGAPWEREVEFVRLLDGQPWEGGAYSTNGGKGPPPGKAWKDTSQGVGHWRIETMRRTTGWSPTCACAAGVEPCRVLDFCSGIGTTGLAALALGRSYTGIEPSERYVALQRRRLQRRSLLATESGSTVDEPGVSGPLFDGLEDT